MAWYEVEKGLISGYQVDKSDPWTMVDEMKLELFMENIDDKSLEEMEAFFNQKNTKQ